MFLPRKKTSVLSKHQNNSKHQQPKFLKRRFESEVCCAFVIWTCHVISQGDFHQIWSMSPHRPTASWDGRNFALFLMHMSEEKEDDSMTAQSSRNCSRLLVDMLTQTVEFRWGCSKLRCRVQRESPDVLKRVFKAISWICEVIATCYVIQPNFLRNQQLLTSQLNLQPALHKAKIPPMRYSWSTK